MSQAGARSDRGDEYQLRVALPWIVRLWTDPAVVAVQVESLGMPGDAGVPFVDDIVIELADESRIYVQAKKNHPEFATWSLRDRALGPELIKARDQLEREGAGSRSIVRFYSRSPFGALHRLAEGARDFPNYAIFSADAPQTLTAELQALAKHWNRSVEVSFELVRRIEFTVSRDYDEMDRDTLAALQAVFTQPEDVRDLLEERLRSHQARLRDPVVVFRRVDLEGVLARRGHVPSPHRAEQFAGLTGNSQIGCAWIPQAFPPHEDVFHPHTLREAFTGRARERQSLTRWWREDGQPVRVLVGMGGLGKSSLAWVWMREDVLGTKVVRHATAPKQRKRNSGLRAAERPDGVLWWSFYAPELQIEQSFELFVDRALSYVTHGQVQPTHNSSLDDRINTLLGRLRHGRYLLILDGFERVTKLYDQLAAPNEAESLEFESVPELRRCSDERTGRFLREVAADGRSRVLITSRVHPKDVDGLADVQRCDLEGLDPEESLALFRTFGVRGTDKDILNACEAVGHHPLAVRLMIGHVNTPGRYRGQIQALPDLSPLLTPEERRRHVFEVTYDTLNQTDKKFFGRVAVYTQAVSYAVLQNASEYDSTQALDQALGRLEQRGFLTFDVAQSTYDMHPLVRQYAYAQMATAERRDAAREAYAYLADRLPKHETTLATLGLTLEVYHQALQGGLVASAHKIFLHRLYPILFFRIGQCRKQVALMEQLIAAGKEHPEQISAGALRGLMDRLGTAYILAGMPREAYRCAMEASAGGDKANRLVYLASSEMRLGKLQSAVQQLEESVRLNLQNGASFAEMIAHLNLGLALTWSARFEEAATHLESASAIIGDTPKRRHWRCIFLVHHARLALLTGRGTLALQHARAAHKTATEDSDEADLVRSQWALGASLVRRVEEDPALAAEYLSEAESHLLAALSTCSEMAYGELIMELHIALAHWHFANKDPAQAEVAAESALTLARKGGHAVKEAEAEEILSELARLAAIESIQDRAGAESTDLRQADQLLAVWSLSSMPHVKSLRLDPRS